MSTQRKKKKSPKLKGEVYNCLDFGAAVPAWSLRCLVLRLSSHRGLFPPWALQGLQPPTGPHRAAQLHRGLLRAGCPMSPAAAGTIPCLHSFSMAVDGDAGGDAGAAVLSPEDLAGDPGRLRSCSRPVQPRCGGLGQPPSWQTAEGAEGPGIGRNGQAAGSPGWAAQPAPCGRRTPPPARLPPAGQRGVSPACTPSPQPHSATPLSRLQSRHPCELS